MIPRLDNGHVDSWPVFLDFAGVGVAAEYAEPKHAHKTHPVLSYEWMWECYWSAWELMAPIGCLRLMTTYPDVMRMGRYVRPGETCRVTVAPTLHWNSTAIGSTAWRADQWPTWNSTPEAWVETDFPGTHPRRVGWMVLHELGHLLVPSPDAAKWNHNPELGTVFTDPIPDDPTVNADLCRRVFGDSMALVAQGRRFDQKGFEYYLPPPQSPAG